MEDTYIKLPVIRKIEVKGYKLFSKDWEYTFKRGLNLFVGANMLGKTTTAYIILYGLVGLPLGKKDFFVDRVKADGNAETEKESARVRLSIEIGKDIIEIERDLFNSNIIFFSQNGKVFESSKNNNLEKLYEENVIKISGISSLDDYKFLLETLLIREEEGNYLLWSPDDQMRVLRLLFNYGNFDQEFRRIRNRVKDQDTIVRGQQDIQKQFKKRLNAIRDVKYESMEKMGAQSLDELRVKLGTLEKSVDSKDEEHEEIISTIEKLEEGKKELTESIYTMNSEIEELDSEITKIENTLYQGIYEDPKIPLANHKLKHYQICIFCNNKIPMNKAETIIDNIESKRICPVCQSNLREHYKLADEDVGRDSLVSMIIEKQKASEAKKEKLAEKQGELDEVSKKMQKLWDEERRVKTGIEEDILAIDDIKIKISRPEYEQKKDLAVYDRDIKTLQDQINHYQGIINEATTRRERETLMLFNKNKEYSERLEKIRDDLTYHFNNYVYNFLGECRLVTIKRRTDESRIPVDIFIPEFGRKERHYLFQVSKSESTFLEYAFRLSLCQVFRKITGGDSLLAIEPSEGIFDIGNVPILAEAISKYYDVSYLLIISNISHSDFLQGIVEKAKKDITERVVNYLEIGKLSEAQKKERERYDKELGRIIGS